MVESRFFGGLEIQEVATLPDFSEITILRHGWTAGAWLAHKRRRAH